MLGAMALVSKPANATAAKASTASAIQTARMSQQFCIRGGDERAQY